MVSLLPTSVGKFGIISDKARILTLKFGYNHVETPEETKARVFSELESKAALEENPRYTTQQNHDFAERNVKFRCYDHILTAIGDVLNDICGGTTTYIDRGYEEDSLSPTVRQKFRKILSPIRPVFEVEFKDGEVTLTGTVHPCDSHVTDEELSEFLRSFKDALAMYDDYITVENFQYSVVKLDALESNQVTSATATYSGSKVNKKAEALRGWKYRRVFMVELFWSNGEYVARSGSYSIRCDFVAADGETRSIDDIMSDLIEAVKTSPCGIQTEEFRLGSPIFLVVKNGSQAYCISIRNPQSRR